MPLFLALCLVFSFVLAGCSGSGSLKITEVTIDQVVEKMNNGETFTLMVVRDSCPYCEAMEEYLDETKSEHGDLEIFQLNSTSYELYRKSDTDRTLIAETEEGQLFLEKFPYFLYTPTLYKIVDGVPESAGVGFDTSTNKVALWGVDSTADLTTADQEDVWTFLTGSSEQQ
jgi:predicted bacteriocin transport accessory protein